MYHDIIQHKGYITEYLRDQILSRKLERPQGHGRIYRVVHDTTKREAPPRLSKATPAELVKLLAHPNGWWRDTAQRLLVERNARAAVPELTRLAQSAPDWRTRLHALWTLDGIDSIEPATVMRAMKDESRDVRASAVRLAERWLDQPGHAIHAALRERMDDGDWAVRRQLTATLGALPAGSDAKLTALASLLERHGDDPIVVDAAVSGLSGDEPAMLQRLLQAPSATPQRAAAAAALAATMVRSARNDGAEQVLEWAADPARPEWQRTAVLEGAEAALLGGPLPGGGRRGAGGRANTPASTNGARGARGGPGGAPAFARAEPEGAPAGRGRGATAAVPLKREPTALVALASAGGPAGKRAGALLARVTWPGRPAQAGQAPAAEPLTAEQQKQFDAGQNVYNSLCVACHQADGRGMENLAPGLVGSPFVVGNPEVAARILLQGKEGKVGLMPPLGTTLSDEQVAAVLTYTRRSWGHGAPVVDAAAVAATRKATADRTRPWTEAELAQIAGGK
jgi:mono/diheme cytochrome c family protein